MSITKILPHPIYLKEGWDPCVRFKCGFDIAMAEVEITKSTSQLSDNEIDDLQTLNIPIIKPIDLKKSEFKFAFLAGYPSEIFK